jgi:threonine dehydratase
MQIKDIEKAKELINHYTHKTPIMSSKSINELIGGKNYFKCENLQKTGSFKVRGAFNNILSNLEENRKKGVIAFSSGNHAQAVAYAALMTGIKATIVMLENVNPIKLEATKNYGAKVILFGNDSREMEKKTHDIIEEENLNLIHPFEDFGTIAGQGTIGLEIMEDFKDSIDEIYIPIGGGGLISGVAISIKSLSPKTKIYGVQPEASCSMYKSIKNNKVSSVESCNTIADGLVAKSPGENTFNIVKEFVDDIILISEKEIEEAVLLLLLRTKMLVEPSGAITLAAMAKNKSKQNKNRLSILSGGNFNTKILENILKEFNNNLS